MKVPLRYRFGAILCRLTGHRADEKDRLFAAGVAYERTWCSRCGVTQDVKERRARYPLPGVRA